jgi:uncharacterized coiled-coil protein SlyX
MKLTGNTQELLQEIAQKTPSYDALMIALTEQYDIVNKKSHVIDEQQKQINLLEEQLRLLRQQRYGKSSEKNAAQGISVPQSRSSLVLNVSPSYP